MEQDIVKSTLTQLGVLPQDVPCPYSVSGTVFERGYPCPYSVSGTVFERGYLDSAAVTAPAQVIEVSVQGSLEAPPAIDAGQAATMDNVIPAPQCETLITCAHAPPLASTSNQLLLTSTSAAVPLLVAGLASRQERKDHSACSQARLKLSQVCQ